jgi:hypothetical protein
MGGYQFLYITLDKFAMWVEVEPVRAETAEAAIKFI